MARCNQCGGEHPPGAVFCPVTGKTIEVENKFIPEEAKKNFPNWWVIGLLGVVFVCLALILAGLLLYHFEVIQIPDNLLSLSIFDRKQSSGGNDEKPEDTDRRRTNTPAPDEPQEFTPVPPTQTAFDDAAEDQIALIYTHAAETIQAEIEKTETLQSDQRTVTVQALLTQAALAQTLAAQTLASEKKPTSTATSLPNSDLFWRACLGTYLSRLQIGDRAYVGYEPPLANRVRRSPSTNADVLGRIQPGEMVTIVDGPVCSNNWVWWKVDSMEQNLVGWTAEGDGEDYWLVPEGFSK